MDMAAECGFYRFGVAREISGAFRTTSDKTTSGRTTKQEALSATMVCAICLS